MSEPTEEQQRIALEVELAATRASYADFHDAILREVQALQSKLDEASACLVGARAKQEAWRCKSRLSVTDPPQDCDWPTCGCDPYAAKVVTALQEAGTAYASQVWQPIETTPRDFTSALLWWVPHNGTRPGVVMSRWMCRTHIYSARRGDCPHERDCNMGWDIHTENMTHWMPLPEPRTRGVDGGHSEHPELSTPANPK